MSSTPQPGTALTEAESKTYGELIAGVKSRLKAAGAALDEGRDLHHSEVAAMHLRHVLEAVALGSLIPHRALLEKTEVQLRKFGHEDARKALRQAHPAYWPEAQGFTREAGYKVLKPRPGAVVLESDYGRWYGRTSDLLHERNPLKPPADLDAAHLAMADLHDRLTRLLVSFTVSFINRTSLLLCQLDNSPTGDHVPGEGAVTLYHLNRTGDLPPELA